MTPRRSPIASAGPPVRERKAPGDLGPGGFHAARLERSRFRINLRRSLHRHRRLILVFAFTGISAAAAYWMANWPVYSAEALVYIQPAPVVQTVNGVTMHWPYNYDPATYDSYVQQQMQSMTRQDMLQNALNKLPGFKKNGEDNEHATQRMRQSLQVGRIGNSYEVSIKALARGAQMSADIANAVAGSYVDGTSHAQQAIDAGRMTMLRAEADRVSRQLQAGRAEQARVRATNVAQNAEQLAELNEEITRLQKRFDAIDAEIQDLSIDDSAPGTALVATAAVVPDAPVADGVVPNAVTFAAAFLVIGILAAVLAEKFNQRLYVAANVEELLGFGPIVELPDFSEVPEEIFEEQLLRLSAAVDAAIGKGNLRSCVFTGAGSASGVTTVATRVRTMMEGMGRSTVLVHSEGSGKAVWPDEPPMLLERLTKEAQPGDGATVIADAAPVSVSAETEYLIRNAACVVVVIESGATTRAQLRSTSSVLRRLDANKVGYVLNRLALADADPLFRDSLSKMEAHVRQRRKAEKERVRTRRVEAEPASPAQQPPPEPVRMTETTPQPAASTGAHEPVRRFAAMRQEAAPTVPEPAVVPPARGRMESLPRPQMKVSTATRNDSQSEPEIALPWWLADAFQNPEIPAPPRQEEALAESAQPVAEPQESRLGGLRKLFINRNAQTSVAATREESPQSPRGATGRVPVPVASADSGETPTRRGTPLVTTVPEFLPPRKTGDVKRDPDAASRRDRRDTLDDVAVLPSWRGQYRRKE